MFKGKKVGVSISNFVFDNLSLVSIKRCISSILAYSEHVDVIYITDDASTHRSVFQYYDTLDQQKVRVIRNHKNRGIAAMKNLGLRLLSDCDYMILMDNDIHVNKGWDSFYIGGMEETGIESVHLSNIFNDNAPHRSIVKNGYKMNYHTKYQGLFMCISKNAYEKVGGFPLLPQRYGAEHYNWQVRLSRALGMEQCVIDFEGGKNFIKFEHRTSSFDTARNKEKQAIINGNASDVILNSGVVHIENEIDKDNICNDVAIIIPFRLASWNWQAGENKDRLSNLLFSIDYYKSIFPNAEMVVVEQDKQPVVNQYLRPDVRYMFLKNGSTFNKSWAYNCAAKVIDKPYLIFMDSDAILRSETISAALLNIRSENCSVYKPYVKFLDLTPPMTTLFKQDMRFSWRENALGSRCAHNPWFIGGCVICKKKEFFQIGGFNEKFRGWGGEDDEFMGRARSLTHCGRIEGALNNIYHMYHMTTRDASPNHELYQKNLNELAFIGGMHNAQLVEYVTKEMIPNMANPEKYANE